MRTCSFYAVEIRKLEHAKCFKNKKKCRKSIRDPCGTRAKGQAVLQHAAEFDALAVLSQGRS